MVAWPQQVHQQTPSLMQVLRRPLLTRARRHLAVSMTFDALLVQAGLQGATLLVQAGLQGAGSLGIMSSLAVHHSEHAGS